MPDFITSQEWPPYSPDLNPMDYYVWGRLESLVNYKEHHSLQELKQSLRREWTRLDQDEVCRACMSWPEREAVCPTEGPPCCAVLTDWK